MKNTFKKAFIDTLPGLMGYLVLGFGFGIIMESGGYGSLLAISMSILIYAGSMQYAAVGLFASGASLVTVAVTTFMVNVRHIFYGISLLSKYKKTGVSKPYLIFSLTDETYSLVCRDDLGISDSERHMYSLFVSILNHSYWVVGTALGVLAGKLVRFNTEGIDFALTALFVTVFVEQWLTAKKYIPAVIGVVVTLVCLIVFGRDSFLIPSMLIIALLLCFYREREKEERV